LADPLSGCRWPGAIAAADALVRTVPVRDWRPDVVLRLGAPWASRVLNEWLASLDCPQVLVDPGGTWAAPDRLPDEVVVARPEAVCLAVAAAVGPSLANSSWARKWARAEELAQTAIEAAVEAEGAMTEPGIARALVHWAPEGSTLVVSSSMPVREVEWWSVPRQGLRVLANRGANGIDGVLSTALGVAASAWALGGRVTALLGDLAFLYDAGALLWAAEREMRLDVVVVDNDGGGIFSFLAQRTGQPPARFESLWGTPHGTDLCAVARSYGVEAARVADLKSLTDALGEPRGRGVRVLVATTDRDANVALHQRLNEAVAVAVAQL
jgi:2-succinyl-5-enolpyruvyl-6-hydroxy-3-cyclohexene-1-carboxylate synthase